MFEALRWTDPVWLRRYVCDVIFARRGGALPASADAHFQFDGSYRDEWIEPYLRALPKERALAIVRRELAAGRTKFARAALKKTADGEALLDEAASG